MKTFCKKLKQMPKSDEREVLQLWLMLQENGCVSNKNKTRDHFRPSTVIENQQK